jgi:hypothetical protein
MLNVYIGEADGVRQRIRQHEANKDWWSQVIVFYNTDGSLTKTKAEYLESITCKRLSENGKCHLMNGNSPSLPSIPSEDIPGLEVFFKNVAIITPLLGFDIFAINQDKNQNSNNIELYCKGNGASATGLLMQDGKIRVYKNSTAVKNNAPSFEKHNYRKLKDELLKIKRLVNVGEFLSFSDDYVFDSSSAAAAVILGRSAAGPNEWKDKNGKKLKEVSI